MKSFQNQTARAVTRGILHAVILSLVLVFLFALVIMISGLSSSFIKPGAQIIKVLSIFWGVLVTLRGVEKRGFDKTTGEDAQPVLSDLRESGAIEQDADIVMFIHNKNKSKEDQEGDFSDAEKRERELIIAKHRSGRQGSFKLHWVGAYTRFFNIPAAQQAQDAKDALAKTNKPAPKKSTKKEATEQKFVASDGADVF